MSLYRFIEKPSGFRVERLSRDRLTVQLEPWALSLRHDGYPAERCSFYDGDRLALLIAARLLGEDETAVDAAHPAIPSTRSACEARTIKTDVGLQRLRLLAQVDPAVHEVQLCARRLAGHVPSLAQEAALYREPHILKDVLTYRAAAIAFAYLQSDLWRPALRVAEESEPPVAELLDSMAHWRGLFSPDGKPYRSLNRTLMNLPRDVPPELVCCLNRVRLERPVIDSLEFTTLMLYVGTAATAPPELALNRFRMFHHAKAAEIGDAMRRIGAFVNRRLRPGCADDIRFTIRYLCDYPEPYHGSLTGLVERVIHWHRQAHERRRLEDLARQLGGPDRRTARPPMPLPALPGVTFLSTVGDVVEEGARMKHCIATHALEAIKGRCFLFHVNYQGDEASVEVSAEGEVADAQGPHNSRNAAVRWGIVQLRSWGEALRPRNVVEPRKPFPPAAIAAGDEGQPPQVVEPPRTVRRARRGKVIDPNQLAFRF